MSPSFSSLPKPRLAVLCIVLLTVLGWNAALASRRKFFSGQITRVERQDIVLTVRCPSKIEPRIQESVRSILRGRRNKIHVQEGDRVAKGDLLVDISPTEIRKEVNQKRIVFENASADHIKATKDLQLARTLLRKGAVSSREVDDANRAAIRSRQWLNTAREELDQSLRKLSGTKVIAPIAGIVLAIPASSKVEVSEGDELLRIAVLDDFIVRGRVDELDISRVRLNQDAWVSCDAFRGTRMPARIAWIGPQAKEGAFAEVEIKLDLLDTKGLNLKPNLTCETFIVTGRLENAVTVPAKGVRNGPEGPYLLKTGIGGWLQRQPVEVAQVTEGSAIISKGISEKDSILVPGDQ